MSQAYIKQERSDGELMDDQKIIRRIQEGDSEAYAVLVEKYHFNLLAFIFRIVRDRHLAEDIGQEVFLSAYKELPGFAPCRGTPFAAWLYIIARNRSIGELRKRKRSYQVPLEQHLWIADERKTAEAELILHEEEQALSATMEQLPEPFRSTILMSLQGTSLSEIARLSGVAQSTVKTRLFRAREKIRLLLKERFGGVSHERRV